MPTLQVTDVIEELTIDEESAILEYERDRKNGILFTCSLGDIRERLGLDN